MANSPLKRKYSEMASDDISCRETVSRSGRVRKPKVFYDPSTVKNDVKRRSMPVAIETVKAKKSGKILESETVQKSDKVLLQEKEKLKQKQTQAAALINNRRRTICASSYLVPTDGKGCIVCSRSDVKKGRFVNCIDCDNRGHFTCLRNDKLFKTADQEHNWQCPTCKICDYCKKFKPHVRIIFHLKIFFNQFMFRNIKKKI